MCFHSTFCAERVTDLPLSAECLCERLPILKLDTTTHTVGPLQNMEMLFNVQLLGRASLFKHLGHSYTCPGL